MANGILTLNPNFPERNLEGEKLPLIEAPVGAGIGLALANFLKDKKRGIGDNNPPSPIDEEKPPQQEPPKGPDIASDLLAETAVRELEKRKNELGPIPKSTDRVKQGKELIEKQNLFKEKQMDLAVKKKKIYDYFEGVDTLYDNEWYGSAESIQKIINKQEDDIFAYTYENNIFSQYNKERPIHEFFEDEYQGGVGDLGNADAAKVMAGGGMFRYGEGIDAFDAPEYYQEYKDKLVDYTIDTLGKEFIAYRLTRQDEIDELLTLESSDDYGIKSFSLDKNTALGFQYLWSNYFTNRDGSPREDLVLIETPVDAESLVMRGKSNENEIVVDGGWLEPDKMNFYDRKGNLLKQAVRGPLKKLKEPIKKAYGGFIDKPLTGNSRYI